LSENRTSCLPVTELQRGPGFADDVGASVRLGRDGTLATRRPCLADFRLFAPESTAGDYLMLLKQIRLARAGSARRQADKDVSNTAELLSGHARDGATTR
jgi:hypothetical protein